MQNPHTTKHHGQDLKTQRRSVCAITVLFFAWVLMGASSVAAGQLSLTWQDNSNNEDGFEIERTLLGESFGLLATVGPDSETYLDETIVPGLEYKYRIRAFNAFGYSSYTNISAGAMHNTAPTLGEIEDVVILKGETLSIAEFAFSDAESGKEDLVVEAISSNLSLVPLEGISVELGEGTGSVSVEPTISGTGTTVISLLLSDGVEVSQQDFEVEILRNLAPAVGSMSAVDVYDSQAVGPFEFTISDVETAATDLVVVGDSLDESLIASDTVVIGGSGENRTVSFSTQPGVSGTTTIRLAVSDGINTTNGALRVNVSKNSSPVIAGLEGTYTIEGDGEINSLAFEVSDRETAAASLDVSVRSSNSLIVSPYGLKLKGSLNQRTLDVTPNPGMTGTVEITLSVSDGVHSVEHVFNLRVLAPEQIVTILGFTIEQSLAVVEVENREGETFTLWKIHSIDGAWENVEDVEVVVGENSTTLVDPTPIDSAVCYRVIASE